MKNISDEEFTKAFEKVSDQIKNLMYSSILFELAEKHIAVNQLDVNPSKTLLPMGYNLLGLLTSDETATALEEVGIKNGLKFLVEVKEKALEQGINTPPTPTEVTPPVLASEIAEAEKEIENLQGIQTMASDMREVQSSTPTYQSSQSDLIRPSTIPPPPTNGPRWETDK